MSLRQQYNVIKLKAALREDIEFTRQEIAKNHVSLKTKQAFSEMFGNLQSELQEEGLFVSFEKHSVSIYAPAGARFTIEIDAHNLKWAHLGFDSAEWFDQSAKPLLIEAIGDIFFESEDVGNDDEVKALEIEKAELEEKFEKIAAKISFGL